MILDLLEVDSMGRRMNWSRAKSARNREDNFAGIIMADGIRIRSRAKDSLAKRAQAEAARWAETLSVKDRLSVSPASPYDHSAKRHREPEIVPTKRRKFRGSKRRKINPKPKPS